MDFDDIVKIVDQVKVLEACFAAVEAERDAAQKRVQDCETRMMRYAIELAEMQAERDAAQAGEARAVAALKEIAVFAQGLRERSDVSTFVVIGHMIEGYLNKHAARAAALRAGEVGDE